MVDSFFNALPEYLELAMRFFPLLLAVASPVALLIAYRKTQRETAQAQENAKLLGLQYINVAEEMKKNKPGDAGLLGPLKGFSSWAMKGVYNGVSVRVELTVKEKRQSYIPQSGSVSVSNPTRSSYSRGTTYTASFENRLPFDVSIGKNIDIPFGLGSAFKKDMLTTGDADLDKMLFISGTDQEKILEWLNTDQRKDALKRMYQEIPSVNVDQQGCRLYDRSKRADYPHLQKNLSVLTDAILQLKTVQ